MDLLGGLHSEAPGLGHDDEQVHIGIRCGCAAGVRAKKDDPLWLEGGGDGGAVTLDVLHGNHEGTKDLCAGPGNEFFGMKPDFGVSVGEVEEF